MTIGKASALTAGFIGAFALGVALGPSIMPRDTQESTSPAPQVTTTQRSDAASPRAVAPKAKAERAKAKSDTATAMSGTATAKNETPTVAAIPASEPELHARLKPVLNRGTRIAEAAEGFRDAEQFAMVAHAARNTKVPFMVLKHRVLEQGQSLAEAIQEYKPELDANSEVVRAREAARADVQAISS